ncbi:hypothetical protein NCCP2495_25180 [Dietzia sp. NCCP-2495]|nr:hypothetical protein NCCP2495_25180 [Dietzia sp. NCCP-2495]
MPEDPVPEDPVPEDPAGIDDDARAVSPSVAAGVPPEGSPCEQAAREPSSVTERTSGATGRRAARMCTECRTTGRNVTLVLGCA